MRYFLISYAWSSNENIHGFGRVLYQGPKFPSESEVNEAALDIEDRTYGIAILSIYEFKNEQDYNDFVK